MNRYSMSSVGAAAALLLASAATFAAPLPPEQHAGDVTYVTGGVSKGDTTAFEQARGGYPLSIELVQKAGAKNIFTADAQVKVLDSAGAPVLDAKADGPFMLVRVPPGHYRVQATLNGHTIESKLLDVGHAGSTRAMLVFPQRRD